MYLIHNFRAKKYRICSKHINPDVPILLIGDSLRIGQVITNLVSNAIKFTQKGEVIVNIDVEKLSNSNEIILLVSVSDTGIGINQKQIPFLFDEFNQPVLLNI